MLDLLTATQQKALLELLIFMAKADGRLESVEHELLEDYAALLDVDMDELDWDRDLDALLPSFDTATSRVVVLQEVLRLSHLDGYFADEERSAIIELAARMGIPLALIAKVEEWVVEGLNWMWRGEALLDEAEEVVRI